MKKVIRAIFFCTSLISISVIIQSCCTDKYKIIGNGTIQILDTSTFTNVDTIRAPFSINMLFESEIAGLFQTGLIQSAYATSCEYVFENPADLNTFEIKSNKGFTYDGQMIEADSDFSNLSNLRVEVFDYFGGELQVHFNQAFLDLTIFDQDDFTFSIKIKTEDDLELSNDVSVFIEL